MDVSDWLRRLDLAQYIQAFTDNAIDWAVLPTLTGDDLKDLGVQVVGHRRKLLNAIAALNQSGQTTPPAAPSPRLAVASAPGAERRQLTVMFCDLVGSTALVDTGRPGGSTGADQCLSQRLRRMRLSLWRLRREIHGRWCAFLFRISAGA